MLEEPPHAEPTLQSATPRSRLSIWALVSTGVLAVALAALALVHFRETPPEEHTLRYTIPLPENIDNILGLRLVISPDGRNVVMAASINGRQQLWLRPLSALDAQPMPGTDGAIFPFWSPDSHWIGFFASGKLRKIAVAGGPSQPIADANTALGGTWNRDGVILFSPGAGESVLRRVSADGGAPADVTKNKFPSIFPVFLPDGRRFLYLVSASAGEKAGIYLSSLDGAEDRRILTDVSSVAFAPSRPGSDSGHILFLRENNLMAQPFDAGSGQILGDVVPVAEGVFPLFNYSPFSVSDNGILLYLSRGDGSATNQIVWYDRTGKILEPISTPGGVWTPSISPDEKTVAFAQYSGANSDLWFWDSAHKVPQRFTTDPFRNDAPVWSPQSDRIVFRSTRTGRQEIWLKAANGSGKDEMLATDTNNKFASQWSPDGRFIVYSDNAASTRVDIWYIALEGDRKPVKFLGANFNEAQGQISPDGKWMAYMSDKTNTREVYVTRFPSGEGEWRISTAGGEQPRWRRDGKELFYVALDGKMMSVAVKATAGPKPAFDRETPAALFDTRIAVAPDTRAFQYDVTDDGKRFVVATNASSTLSPATPTLPPLTVVVNWFQK